MEEVRDTASSSISLVLVGNKSDMKEERKVSEEEARKLAEENGMGYVETSAKMGTNISEAFEKVTEAIFQKVESGVIDVTKETSGVRLGSEVKVEKLRGVQEKFGIDLEQRRNNCAKC